LVTPNSALLGLSILTIACLPLQLTLRFFSYCWGAKYVTDLNSAGVTTCSVLAHPSRLKKEDIASLKGPTSFALGEVDHAFSEDMITFSKKKLDELKVANEFVVYEGTTHGFAARGNLDIEVIRKGYEGALAQTAAWFTKYLL
jgi:carboxymethylenebutenolidase